MKKSLLGSVMGLGAAVLVLTGCNNNDKDEAQALMDENQALRAQLDQANVNLRDAEDRAAREAAAARSAEERAMQTSAPVGGSGFTEVDATANTAAPAPEATVHTVQKGETLSHIALKYYRDPTAWQRIYEANRELIGANPNAVKVGQRLTIPGA